MASPCKVVFNNKEIPYDEFLAMLHDGLLEDLVNKDIIDTSKFTDVNWELNQQVKNGNITPEQRDAIISGKPNPISEEDIASLESKAEDAEKLGKEEEVIQEADAIIGDAIPPVGEPAGAKPTGAKPAGPVAEIAKPPVEPPKTEPKNAAGEGAEKIVGLTKSDLEKSREDNNIKDTTKYFEKSPYKSFWNQIKNKIESGEINPSERINEKLAELQTAKDPSEVSVTSTDPLIGHYERITQENRLNEINDALDSIKEDKSEEGDIKRAGLVAQRAVVEENLKKALDFIDFAGSTLAKGLGSIATQTSEGLDFVRMKRNQEAVQGSELTKQQEEKFRAIDKKAKETNERIQKLEKENEELRAKERKQAEEKKVQQFQDEVKKEAKKRKYGLSPEKDTKHKELAKKFRGEYRDVTRIATLLADKDFREYATLTAEKFAGDFKMFAKEMIDTLGQKIRPHLGDIWADIKGDDYKTKRSEKEISNDFDSMVEKTIEDSEGELHEGLFYHLQKLARNRVEAGMTDINEITDSIYDALSEGIPDLDRQELKDAITEYGKFKKLSQDEVTRALAEAKNIGRLQSKYEATERGELPLRNGFERAEKSQEARDLERQILKNIKEKDLKQPLTAEQQAAQYKTAEEANHRRLENAISDIEAELRTGVKREKGTTRKFTDDETKRLQRELADLKKIRDERFKHEIAEDRVNAKIKSTQKVIDELNNQIAELSAGKTPAGELKVKSKEGKKIFGYGKEKVTTAEDVRITSLKETKAALEAEISELIPETIKNKALIERYKKSRENRKAFLEDKLERGKTDPSVFASKPSPERVKLDNEAKQLNKDIKKLQYEVEAEKKKAEEKQKSNFVKNAQLAGKLLRFNLFLNPKSMGKLTLAALYRPLSKSPYEVIKYALSNTPGVKKVFEKSPTTYTPTGKELGKTLSDYYVNLVSKETAKSAWSEFKDRSEWELTHEKPGYEKPDGFRGKVERILEKPEQVHGFLKAFPKEAEYKAAYEKALRNLANTIDPETGTYYDITDLDVIDQAKKMAEVSAKSAVYMNENFTAEQTSQFIRGLVNNKNATLQSLGVLLQQQMPVVKVPANFFYDVFTHVPIAGSVEALGILSKGVKGLSAEEATRASKVITNQIMGALLLAAGSALYKQLGDDELDKIEEAEYWFHNSAFPLIITGMQAQKRIDLNANRKNTRVSQNEKEYMLKDNKGNVVSTLPKSWGKKQDKDDIHRKLIKSANQERSGVKTYADAIWHMAKDETKKLPQVRSAKELTQILESDKALSNKAAQMISNILIPKASYSMAEMMDNEQKRDPDTWQEIMMMSIPGMRKNIPLKNNWTIESWEKEHEERKTQHQIDKINKDADRYNKTLGK